MHQNRLKPIMKQSGVRTGPLHSSCLQSSRVCIIFPINHHLVPLWQQLVNVMGTGMGTGMPTQQKTVPIPIPDMVMHMAQPNMASHAYIFAFLLSPPLQGHAE